MRQAPVRRAVAQLSGGALKAVSSFPSPQSRASRVSAYGDTVAALRGIVVDQVTARFTGVSDSTGDQLSSRRYSSALHRRTNSEFEDPSQLRKEGCVYLWADLAADGDAH